VVVASWAIVDNNATARPRIRVRSDPRRAPPPLPPEDPPISPPRPGTPALAAGSQLAWLAVAAAAWCLALAALPVDPDYTAGELLDHLASWRETGVLYPALGDGAPWRVLNYPPLALLAARVMAELGLPELAAGRAGNGLALLALLGAAAAWARARGARGAALAGTVGLLGASFPVLYAAGQFHIELWAVAFTVAGFALLDRGSTRRSAALAGVALALACWSKQTQVVPAAVALAWAWRWRRVAALPATGAFALAGLLGAAGITAAWGLEPWRHMLAYTVGTYSLTNLGSQALSHALPWIVLLAFVANTARSEGPPARRDPLLWLWIGALAWSLSSARVGSSYAYFLDLHVATALWAGPRLFGGGAASPSRAWRWILAVQLVAADVGTGAALGVNVARLREVERGLPAVCAALGGRASDAAPSPASVGAAEPLVLSEEVGVARACGRRVAAHPFIMASLAEQGRWDPAPLDAAFRAGDVPVALLAFDPREPALGAHGERWPPSLLRSFAQAPVVERAGAGFWVARW